MIITLIGYRSTGKTTVARLMGQLLAWSWLDTDVEVERRVGKSITAMFAEEGEEAFRRVEQDVVALAAKRERTVVAAGGGIVLGERNRAAIRTAGKVVWLKASVETILERMAGDPTTKTRRPDLTTAGGRAEVERLLAERTPLYAGCADYEVDTDDRSPHDVAQQILTRWELLP